MAKASDQEFGLSSVCSREKEKKDGDSRKRESERCTKEFLGREKDRGMKGMNLDKNRKCNHREHGEKDVTFSVMNYKG